MFIRDFLLSSIFAVAMLLSLSAVFAAQDVTDEADSEPNCTLAEQIMSSNTGQKVGDCPILEGMEAFQLGEDILLTESLPTITSYFIIDGNGHTISGDNRFRIFEVNGGRLTISNLHMMDGKAGLGSAIFADQGATVYLESSSIKRGVATYSGAIFARYSQLYINSSEISWNIADQGAAIYGAASNIQVTLSRFEGNGSREGGAIYHYLERGTIKSSEFHNNMGSEDGGAVVNAHGVLQIRDSLFSQNSASAGGAIYSLGYDSLLTIADSRFDYNESSGKCGAIFTTRGAFLLGFSSLQNNSARDGSGVYTDGGSIMILDTALTDDDANDDETLIHFAESDVRFLDIREN